MLLSVWKTLPLNFTLGAIFEWWVIYWETTMEATFKQKRIWHPISAEVQWAVASMKRPVKG